jgi:hypothetical protein
MMNHSTQEHQNKIKPATPGLLTLTAVGWSFGSHGCRQISFLFKFAPQKVMPIQN